MRLPLPHPLSLPPLGSEKDLEGNAKLFWRDFSLLLCVYGSSYGGSGVTVRLKEGFPVAVSGVAVLVCSMRTC